MERRHRRRNCRNHQSAVYGVLSGEKSGRLESRRRAFADCELSGTTCSLSADSPSGKRVARAKLAAIRRRLRGFLERSDHRQQRQYGEPDLLAGPAAYDASRLHDLGAVSENSHPISG